MATEITPGDPRFDDVALRLSRYLDNIESTRKQRLLAEEASFREFCAIAIHAIAEQLGYIIKNVDEFVRDIAWSFREGWQDGVQRARRKRLRP